VRLRDAFGGGLGGQALLGLGEGVLLADLAAGTALGGEAQALAGRDVLLATRTQLTAGIALVELDGLARRIVICPPDLSPEHRAAIARDAGIDAVVTDLDPAEFAHLEGALVVRPSLPLAPATPPAARGDTEWVMLTSGTTGVPKMVAHTLAGLTGAIRAGAAPGPGTVWATFYDIRRYGGLQIFLRAVLGGASMVLSSAGEPIGEHLARLAAAGVTHVSGTPSHWRRALMSPQAALIAPLYARLSGEIADQAVLDNLKRAYPRASVGHAFASTEAGVVFEVVDGLAGFPASYLERDGAVRLKIEDGSLRVRSSRAASGYVANAAALRDAEGFVDTGDMVERRGDRYHFVGRRGGIINVGGLKVHPEEVEAAINAHARVRMSLVKARRNPITGAVVAADIVLEETARVPAGEGGDDTLRADILAACHARLPAHKVPAVIRFVPSLAVTAAGKLDRGHA
jgi:acyl-coenzyme A synthetase/AMP-(fatty) acid ligase